MSVIRNGRAVVHVCTSWGWTGNDDYEGRPLMRCWNCDRVRIFGETKLTDCVTQRDHDVWLDGHYWGEQDAQSDAEFDNVTLREENEELRTEVYGLKLRLRAVDMSTARLNPYQPNRRNLGDSIYYVVADKRGRKWRVDVRYHFGPFSPLVLTRTFRYEVDAGMYYWFLTADAVRAEIEAR